MQITAEDVFQSDNITPKKYFGRWKEDNKTIEYGDTKDICDVLLWMYYSSRYWTKIPDMAKVLTSSVPLTLQIKHKAGTRKTAGYKNGILTLDSDFDMRLYGYEIEDEYPIKADGNVFGYIMRFMIGHEFFHHAQTLIKGSTLKPDAIIEGTARMFEDLAFDTSNPYQLKTQFFPMYDYGRPRIYNVLHSGFFVGSSRYKTFAFWKLIQAKCNRSFNMESLLQDGITRSAFKKVADGCSRAIPNVLGDKLAGAFAYYNWAIIFRNNFTHIEVDEGSLANFFKASSEIEYYLSVFVRPYFENTVSMLGEIRGSSISAFGASSFFISHNTISQSDDNNITLIFKGDKNLRLLAIQEGSSNSQKMIKDKFSMAGDSKPYLLTKKDRRDGLFITITNTTEKKISIDKLELKKIIKPN